MLMILFHRKVNSFFYWDYFYLTSELQASFVMWGSASWIRGSDPAVWPLCQETVTIWLVTSHFWLWAINIVIPSGNSHLAKSLSLLEFETWRLRPLGHQGRFLGTYLGVINWGHKNNIKVTKLNKNCKYVLNGTKYTVLITAFQTLKFNDLD